MPTRTMLIATGLLVLAHFSVGCATGGITNKATTPTPAIIQRSITAEEWRSQGGCQIKEPRQKPPQSKWAGDFFEEWPRQNTPRLIFMLWPEGQEQPELLVVQGKSLGHGDYEFQTPPNDKGFGVIRLMDDDYFPGEKSIKVFMKDQPRCWFDMMRAKCGSEIAEFRGTLHFVNTREHPSCK